MTRLIRAARLVAHGAPLRIEQVPLREPGPDEVVVELAAAGVNPIDGYRAAGLVGKDAPLPRTLGGEAAGWLEGQPVLVSGGGLGDARDGCWAEAVTVDSSCVTPLDPGVDLQAAAGLGIVGVTAWQTVVDIGRVTEQDRVLVLAAAGGMGLSIISLAVAAGATVLGQVGSEAKAEAVRRFAGSLPGGERVSAVAADAPTLTEAAGDFAPTIVFDSLGGAFTPAALSLLALRGRLVLFGTTAGSQSQLALQPVYRASQQILGYGGLALSEGERRAGVAAAAAALSTGQLRIEVGRVLPLSEAAAVFDVAADRARVGKLIIDCTA